MTATAEPEIGKARVRKEDEHLITGRTRWTDNIVLPGMQHLAILRSPVAHARITGIDTTAARGMPGVVAVFTGADLAAEQGSLPNAWPDHRGHEGAAGTLARGGHGELRRRSRRRRGGPQRL